MAGQSRALSAGGRYANRVAGGAERRRRRAYGPHYRRQRKGTNVPRRRDVLKFAAASLTLLVSRVGAGATPGSSILAVRVWPARDYTRVTLEHDQPIKYSHLLVKDPDRLVLD